MRTILNELIPRLEKGASAVLCGIVKSSGSVPRSSGARMLVCEGGALFGSIGGGIVEGRCRDDALKLLTSGEKWAERTFSLEPSDAASAGMVCGGNVTVLLQRMDRNDLVMMKRISSAIRQDRQPSLVTLLPDEASGPVMTLLGDGGQSGLSAAQEAAVLKKKKRGAFLVMVEEKDMLVEPLVHPGVVHLIGAGHVALATARLAAFAGFDVVVKDDRAEFANCERYPEAREVRVIENFNDCLGALGGSDYLIIVTRGHVHDRDVLAQALKTDAGYIGMIGSSKKRKAVYESLLEEGFTETDLARVYSPIGLSIGADTPAEIGISIVAELIKVRAEVAR